MARTSQIAQVGKRKIELSNLQKVLYPGDHIVKAELIEYYLTIAPTILSHIKGRPLSLVRFPDGIDGEKFFQKNRPEWAPEWLEYVTLGSGEEKKDYILATEAASLVWLANLACIELHQMHCRGPKYDTPDYFVFDLDPPETFSFPQVAELALELKEHIESFGYHPFVKTTGRKGLHVLVPVEPKWSFEKVFQVAEAVAKPFVAEREKLATERQDIYQKQEQLRANLQTLQPTGQEASLRSRMLGQLETTQNRLEEIDQRIAYLNHEEEAAEHRIEAMIAALG
ncbi:hypothetical protein FBQ87_12580 [Sphingobacteriales bacterium CHB3]|nr:hypothetical protein [Sphingobacteriales bacterium CHB3]